MQLAIRRAVAALVLSAPACAPRVSLLAQAPASLHLEPPGHETATVTKVIDGDTLEVVVTARVEGPGAGGARPGQRYHVRLLGIDTPETVKPGEPVECFGREASAAARVLLEGEEVRLVDDVENEDSYDRLLRYVYLDHEMANARLVVNGYASVYTHPPNVRHADLLVALQAAARAHERGLWSPGVCPRPPDGPS